MPVQKVASQLLDSYKLPGCFGSFSVTYLCTRCEDRCHWRRCPGCTSKCRGSPAKLKCSPPPPRLEHCQHIPLKTWRAGSQQTRERQDHDGDDAEEERNPGDAPDGALSPLCCRRRGIVLGVDHFVGVHGLLRNAGFTRVVADRRRGLCRLVFGDFDLQGTPEDQPSCPLKGLRRTGPCGVDKRTKIHENVTVTLPI